MRLLLATVTASSGGLVGLFHNGAFVAAFLGFFFAQSAKVFTHYYTERKWDFTRLVSSGGMPSSHTGLVSVVLLTRSSCLSVACLSLCAFCNAASLYHCRLWG